MRVVSQVTEEILAAKRKDRKPGRLSVPFTTAEALIKHLR